MENQYLNIDSESQVRSYCRRFPVVFERGIGSEMFDEGGKSYIDFLSGAGALNYGHNNQKIMDPVIRYLKNDGVVLSLDLYSKSKSEFISTFRKIILEPRGLNYTIQFTSPTGTSVIESSVKLARKYTGRENIVCFTNAFHGMTGVSLNLTGSKYHRQNVPYSHVTRLPFDQYMGESLDSIDLYRKLLEDPSSGLDLPAAIILETVQGEGGLNVASLGWLKELRKLTEQFGILLIVDDIQAGCGRTGAFFSFERAGITPDMVCLSKSIGGIGFPMAILLVNPLMDIWKPAEDNGTFRGNNLAFVASKAMIESYWSNKKFEKNIVDLSNHLQIRLLELEKKFSSLVAEVKGIGLMQGLRMAEPKYAAYLTDQCFKKGLIIECCGPNDEVLKLMPPLTIDSETLDVGIDIIESSLGQLYSNCSDLAGQVTDFESLPVSGV